MKQLSLDIETYSECDLTKSGVYRYAADPTFEILLIGYSVDGGEVCVVDIANGEELPPEIRAALTDDNIIKWAYNANFERACLSRYLGMPVGTYIAPESWRCSMVWAATLGLPQSLEGVGAVLGLEKQKLKEGKDLIKYFCVPCAPTKANGSRMRNLPRHDPQKWELFKAYNKRDVETEMGIQQKLSKFPVPDEIWAQYHLDQRINDRGIAVDMELVHSAITIDGISHEKLMKAMQEMTALDNPNSAAQIKRWLAENDLPTETLGKKEVAAMLKTAPPKLAEVLMLRQQIAKSSVKKYTAMETAVCSDGRARGMFKFYGANRTGRFSGKIIQLQNLPQNHLSDLREARELVKSGDYDTLEMLYDSIPDVLSQLIRTAFVPKDGCKFIVADFSAIEARVLSWLAGEQWVLDTFAKGGDIYCETAARMFHCKVEKHGENAHLRQKGKQATLSCIAEGQLVLTDKGLIPIEKITTEHLLWDGENWTRHEGVIYMGEKGVITYDGLTATPDHLVWVKGQSQPVHFGTAAACGSHLVQTGNGRRAVRLGENYKPGKKVEQGDEPLLCFNSVSKLRCYSMAATRKPHKRSFKRLSAVFTTTTNSSVVGQEINSGKTTLRKQERSSISQLRRKGNKIRVFKRHRSRTVLDRTIWNSRSVVGNRQDRQQRKLCQRKCALCNSFRKRLEHTKYCIDSFRAKILAILLQCCDKKTISRINKGGNNSRCGGRGFLQKEALATHIRKVRVYDIRNAGRYHRFTVSGKLVHNCGYGGSVGALTAMGALEMGLQEEELKPLVDMWRAANPNIVQYWWNVDKAVIKAVRERTTVNAVGLTFAYKSGMLFITLPSGRKLAYVKPRIGENRFGGESVTYEGVGENKKWERLESYGAKFVENITQAISRDILCYAMGNLTAAGCEIAAHVHDECIIEAPKDMQVQTVCDIMGQTPPWANGLLLRADGYECDFYKKD